MTVFDLKQKLKNVPDHYEVTLYDDAESEGIAISNPEGIATTIETVIEIP